MSFSEEKRKKLIVPAVALMMCAVAMIGVGYAAINSSITNTDNVLKESVISVDLYDSMEGTTAIGANGFNSGKVVYSTHKVSGSEASTKYDVAEQTVTMNSEPIYIKASQTNPNTSPETVELSISGKITPEDAEKDVTIKTVCIAVSVGENTFLYSVENPSDTFNLSSSSGNALLTLNTGYAITVTAVIDGESNLAYEPKLPTLDFVFTVQYSGYSPA